MTLVFGNSRFGSTSGADGHRTVVDYSYSQNIEGNYTDVSWAYGVDYGDPNYWNNITNRSVAWSVATGASVAGVAGFGTGTSSSPIINTSNPGYGGQIHYFWTGTARITHNSNGQGTIRLNAAMSYNSNLWTSSITNYDIALPDIVQDPVAPGTPTGTRINDGQIDLSWTNNSSSHHEYASQTVQRSVDGAASATIATISAGATSYSDTTTSANHRYRYKIQATNAAGSATSAQGSSVYTTPGTPTIGTATKEANSDITLSWTNNIGYGDTTYGTDVYESLDGGAFTYTASVSGGLTTWTDVAPDTGATHAYKVLHTKGALFSSLSSASNTVTLLSTAGAPTGLSPSGVARDAADDITLSWTHNPTDGTPQSKRHVQYKVNAGSYGDAVNDSSTTSSYTISGGTLTNGDTITWKVATAGENGTLGTDSAEASFTLSAKPTVTINEPDAVYDTSTLTVEWGYFQAQSSAQAAWEAKLYDIDALLIETISGTTETEGTFTHTVEDGGAYTVTVTVTSAVGVTSTEDSEAFSVAYLLPAAISIAGEFDNTAGFVVLTLTGGAASSGYSGLLLDGSGDYASTPDAAALDIADDIDIRIDLELSDWTPAATMVLVAKWEATSDERAYEVVLTTGGLIRFRMTTDGTSGTVVEATSSAAPTPVDDRLSLRIDRNSGVVTFYTSTDTDLANATWAQLGTTDAAAGTIYASTAALQVGADGDGTAGITGTVYSAEVRNSADVVVADPNFAAEDAGTTSFADDAGLTWTVEATGDAEIVTVVAATEAIATVDVQRQIDGGEWVTILTDIVLDASSHTAVVQDTVPITVGSNNYRAVAYSALPSSVMSAEDEVTTAETEWGYLSGGTGFGTVARFRAMPTFGGSAGRAKALYHFADREDPVQLAGTALTATLAVSGKLSSGSGTAAEFEALGQSKGVVCWRGPDGRRVFGSVPKVDTGASRLKGLPTVAFTITKLDFTEGDQ